MGEMDDTIKALGALQSMLSALDDLSSAADMLSAQQKEQSSDAGEISDRINAILSTFGEQAEREITGEQGVENIPAEAHRESPVLTVHSGDGTRKAVDVARMRKLSSMADRLFLDEEVDEEDYAERILVLGHMARESGMEKEAVLASMLLAAERFAHMHALPGLLHWSNIIPQGGAIGDLPEGRED